MNLFNLVAKISLDDKEYEKKIKSIEKNGRRLEKVFTQIGNGTGKVGKAVAEVGEASASLAKKVTLTGAAIGAVITGLTLHGGFARAMAIEEAQSKLKGLGHSTESVKQIMDNALASVKGTAFGLGDAASLAAQLVAAGIEPGEQLERTLRTVADTAAISGREMGQVGLIFAKVASKGKVQGEELVQLMESGIPVLQLLGKSSSVTEKAIANFGDSSTASIQALVSKGLVDFADLEEAMRIGVGGSALEMGNTFRGSLSNMKAALGRIGAEIVTPFMEWVVVISKDLIPSIDSFGNKVKEIVPKITDFVQNSSAIKPIITAIAGAITTAAIPGLIGMAAATISATLPLLPLIAAGAALGAIFSGIQNSSGIAKVALIALGVVVGTFTASMLALTAISKLAAVAQAKDAAAILVKTAAMVINQKITKTVTAAQWLLNAALTANPIGLVIAGVAGLIAILGVLFAKNETFRNGVIGLWDSIKKVGQDAWSWITKFFTEDIPSAFNSLFEFLKGIPAWYVGVWISIFEKTKEWAVNIGTYLAESIAKMISNIQEWFMQIPYYIGYAFGFVLIKVLEWVGAMNNFFNIEIPKMIAQIDKWFEELPIRIKKWFDKTLADIVKWGTDLQKQAEKDFSEFIKTCEKWIEQLPIRFEKWMNETIAKIVKWGQDLYKEADKNVSEFIKKCEKWLEELPVRFKKWLDNTIKEVTKWGQDLYKEGKKNIDEFIKGIEKDLEEMPKKFRKIGSDCLKGIIKGFNDAKQWVHEQIGKFMGGIVDGAKGALGIHSPSRVFRDEVGVFMAQGVGVGFEEEMEDVNADIQNSLMYDFDTPTAEQKTGNKIDSVINLLGKLLEKETTIDIDGRSAMRALSPYQEEFYEYDSRNPSFA